jgi:hypothetical protein
VAIDEVPQRCAKDRRLDSYRRLRQETPETADGQLQLANACARMSLTDQERAHLTKALDLDPDNPQARRQLGYRRVSGEWLREAEIRQAVTEAKQAAAALAKWTPEFEKLGKALTQGNESQHHRAVGRLMAIDDPAAIPAMELVLSTHDASCASLVVEALGKMQADEASVALARQAVLSPWRPVREAAAAQLKSRPLESYVPTLLSSMASPIRSRVELYQAPGGRLMHRHTLHREGQKNQQLLVFETVYGRTFDDNDAAEAIDRDDLTLGPARATRDAINRTQRREAEIARQNAQTGNLNQRICEVLSTVTHANLPQSPEQWWQWWNDYNEVFVSGSKPLTELYQQNEVTYASLRPPTLLTADCLASGTPVWTESGPVAVDEIRVGDRVLSQDPKTGELAYKPVLRTTVRPAGPLFEIQAGSETIRSNGGHLFWVSGEGWVKARKLQSGCLLHRVTGATRIDSVEQVGERQTHNLVVADFHTYFVGKAKILSHDNTIHSPTDAEVPGLVGR